MCIYTFLERFEKRAFSPIHSHPLPKKKQKHDHNTNQRQRQCSSNTIQYNNSGNDDADALPGARRAPDGSSRAAATRPEVRAACVRFSPTGREWAAATPQVGNNRGVLRVLKVLLMVLWLCVCGAVCGGVFVCGGVWGGWMCVCVCACAFWG